ncbi:aldose 1-epimerase family protein [Liquorilactobacillus sicerae]|uniref:aldose 1-epimerase family protein n=1 Tax=Liquorilactobacillus sicerae TaxID=1416943 RepID=UPI00248003C3|nr:aldose 1-epimerase family protein [Liquorilactobacillus sicerae]
MLSLENNQIKAVFSQHGAELQSLIDQKSQKQYLWQADPKFWGRHAPILFPIVGRLKDDQYQLNGQSYHLHQHGFARDLDFTVIDQQADRLTFSLQDSAVTREVYPFAFDLQISYQLTANHLTVSYRVKNPAEPKMLFSIGGHPAFTVPLADDETFDDYLVEFQPVGNYQKIPLVGNYTDSAAAQTDRMAGLKLSHEAFKNDALIYQLKQKTVLELTTSAHQHGVLLDLPATDYVGIWSPYPVKAPFVCLEPWWGLADDRQATGDFTQKRGLHQLTSQQEFVAKFTISIF